jgi:hypothetical protein
MHHHTPEALGVRITLGRGHQRTDGLATTIPFRSPHQPKTHPQPRPSRQKTYHNNTKQTMIKTRQTKKTYNNKT